MTKIVTSIIEDNVDDCINSITKCKNTDIIELRIDYIKNINIFKLEKIIKSTDNDLIITCRLKSCGGKFNGIEKNRIKLLKHAMLNKVKYVDIELESNIETIKDLIKNKNLTKIILSHHNFKNTPQLKELQQKYNEINLLNPDLIKIITYAKSINDCFIIFELLKNKTNLIGLCMGINGNITRILAPKFGSCFTYSSVNKGKKSAPGQIPFKELIKTYNFKNINNKTKILGVIGEHAQNSKSKFMHNPNFKKLNLNYVYVPFIVKSNELSLFMKNFRKFNFSGAAVTIPHKEKIIEQIDKLDSTAKTIGATNTLVNKNNIITGYNTDYYGAIEALKEKTNLKNKNILIIGAGGASRAIIYGLKKENCKTTIVNRTKHKAIKLANEFNIKYDDFKNIKELIKQNDIIINSTSVGMNPNSNNSIIKKKDIVENKIIMDIIYNPIITKLIKYAKEKNCITITGERMLIYQAIGQFEKWTNFKPNFKQMKKKLLNVLNNEGEKE